MEVLVRGIVQGVGFRPFIYRISVENGLLGYVRNRGDAGVEIVVEGSDGSVKRFLNSLRRDNPPLSHIYDLSVNHSEETGSFSEFRILKSLDGGDLSGSTIPPDVSICNQCLKELRDPGSRRYNYFFTTCTQCGPRYTIIDGLPYDRPNTTMKEFPMCEDCRREYVDPLDRRFHAQTVACQKCGPEVYLTNNLGEAVSTDQPVRYAGELVEDGYLVAVKGNGGFHIASSTVRSSPISRLRSVKHRSQKPFAVMARSLEAAKHFARVSRAEEMLLSSSVRPIVLLKKRRNFPLSDLISPGLHNIGVMLPYTGLHYMLFDGVSEAAFVMTSANPSNQPIVIDNREAFKKLGGVVDYFLFHNRAVAQRCDDSVVRVNSGRRTVIRRSRGYAPTPIPLRVSGGCCLGVGAEENVNSCIVVDDKAFISQYIGDIDMLETYRFLKGATDRLVDLTKGEICGVGCDLHPRFITRKLAEEYGRRFDCPVTPVQHHHAHALSLMGEWGVEEAMIVVCDGAGYGLDGRVWGGEVLHCTPEGFQRVGHLQYQPMPGGDLAAKYPLRMAAGALREVVEVEEWLSSKVDCFPHGWREVKIVLGQLEGSRQPLTSSCGRILDAASAILGICQERTYSGEPALKLESKAFYGEDVLNLEHRIRGNVVDTSYLLGEVFENRECCSAADLAHSSQAYLAEALASIALEEAEKGGVEYIGFSGGVAYNEHMARVLRESAKMRGFKHIYHRETPPGDGGISFGQALGASRSL